MLIDRRNERHALKNKDEPKLIALGGLSPKKVVYLTLCIYLLFAAHFMMPTFGTQGLDIPANMVSWTVAGVLIGAGFAQIAASGRVVFSRFSAVTWIGFLLLSIPLVYPEVIKTTYSIPRSLGLLGGLLVLHTLMQFRWSSRDIRMGLVLLMACVALEMALGLVQYFLLSEGNWLGYDVKTSRPFGSFRQPNVMSSLVATGLAVGLYLSINVAGRKHWQRARWWFFHAALCGFFLVILQSRTGQLGALLALLLLLPLAYSRNPTLVFVWLLSLSLGLLMGIGALNMPGDGPVRGSGIYTQASARVAIYQHSIHMIQESPWRGFGYGNFAAAWQNHYAADARQNDEVFLDGLHNLHHPHNELLLWAVEGGIVPVAGIFLIIGVFLWQCRARGRWRVLALLALPLPMALNSETEFPFYSSVLHWLIFLSLIFLVDLKTGRQLSFAYPRPELARLLAWVIPTVLLVFMLSALQANYMLTRFEATGRTNGQWLTRIVNPLPVLNRLDANVMHLVLQRGLDTGDQKALQDYVHWSEKRLRHKPVAEVFHNRVLALQALGQTITADAALCRARYLMGNHRALASLESSVDC